MKNIFKFLTLLSFVILLASCEKESTSISTNNKVDCIDKVADDDDDDFVLYPSYQAQVTKIS